MSRQCPNQISLLAWRAAVIGLAAVTGAAIIAALFVAGRGQAINPVVMSERLDEDWTIRSGRATADRVVLRPAAGSIGLALHPIDSSTFTLQTRVEFDSPRGAGGLIVQADDPDHFTAFLIGSDGYFRVSDYRNGAWIDRAAWRTWPHIRRDGAANTLRAECTADACTFFINDERTWRESALPATRWIGVMADAPAAGDPFEARFDEIGWRP